MVDWFKRWDESAEDWCRQHYFGRWTAWRAAPPTIIQLTTEETARLECEAARLGEWLKDGRRRTKTGGFLTHLESKMGFGVPWDKEPDFINELGVKWWRDASTTHYAQKPDIHGTVLDVVCWFVEEPGGRRTRMLISNAGEIIEEDPNLEALAIKIDIRKFLKRDHEKHPGTNS